MQFFSKKNFFEKKIEVVGILILQKNRRVFYGKFKKIAKRANERTELS